MDKLYQRKCKCCGEPFETNRSDKYYLDRWHQVKNNNRHQSLQRKRHVKMTLAHVKTYKIYNDLLKNKSEIKISKEFLRGRGANLALFSHADFLDDKQVLWLFDIAIIDTNENIILKRK